MPFLLAEVLNFQCTTHLIGVGSLSKLTKKIFICCDECEAEWNNPEDALKGINGTRNKHGEIEYPNIEDILREKWSVSINEHHN